MEITYGSVCSGIEAATMAWHPLGMRAAWFAEIEPFPSAVLAHHSPDTPNLGDMTRPLKQWIHAYQDFEDWIWQRVSIRFDISPELPACVRQADLIALATERRDLMPADPTIWDCLIDVEPMTETIRPWSAIEARLTFHQRLMDQLSIEHRRKAA